MAIKKAQDPSSVSLAYEKMAPKWEMIETLLSGTEAMREAGRKYLPQHAEESNESYKERLQAAVLFNMTDLTLDNLVGKPFSRTVRFTEDTPKEIVDMEDDIDMLGNNLTTFLRNWFRDGLAKGLSHVLVDFPVLEEGVENRTRLDDMVEARRPYFYHIAAENLIFAASDIVNGREVLTQVRIREYYTELDGYAEVTKERIRVLTPGLYEVFEKQKRDWVVVDSGETGIDFIPLVTFYTNRKGLMYAKPPLEDLAYLNITHWQSWADQRSILTVARFPMLAVAGASDQSGTEMAIGPKQLLGTRDPQGRFYYVEHNGAAIEVGSEDIAALESKMKSYGAEFLIQKPGNMSATEAALDSAESTSILQDFVTRFVDSVETALSYAAMWLDIEYGGSIDIEKEFDSSDKSTIDLQSLNFMRSRAEVSLQTYWDEMRRHGVFGDAFSTTEELKRLKKEAKDPFLQTLGVGKPESSSRGNDRVGDSLDKEDASRATTEQQGDEGLDDAASARRTPARDDTSLGTE